MLDNLLEIEVAYSLLETSEGDGKRDAIDVHYDKLKTDINVLDKKSDEFKILEKYVKNTHAATHSMYKLKIEQVKPNLCNKEIIIINPIFFVDLQDLSPRRIEKVRKIPIPPKQNASLARISYDELCRNLVSGSPHCPSRSPSHWLHVWKGNLFRGHGLKVCQLLQHESQQQHWSHAALRRRFG